MARADVSAARTFETLLRRAQDDPNVLAFWLGGSRGMGRPTEHSDYDCFFIVDQVAYPAFQAEFGLSGHHRMDWRPGIDLVALTFPMFEALAPWTPEERGGRYAFAHLNATIDKTGRTQPLIDAKACVPANEVASFIHASLDHALNQAYRALKCLRDGDPEAGQLEAAEGVAPFLDAAFALHGRRLRPYYKYLRWELETFPLDRLPFGADELLSTLAATLTVDGGPALCRLLAQSHDAFRQAGHGGAFDGWEGALAWILAGAPAP
ncbi:MAG TPA: hypothetical protein VMU37_02340 [Caulobacteraceae bacterium]|nr:hypothetical protein [Caulobacteraceae bacterium]